jgi:hypothetical protein
MLNRPARAVSLNLIHSVCPKSLSLARIRSYITMSTNCHKIGKFVPFLDAVMPHIVWNSGISGFAHPPSIVSKDFESSQWHRMKSNAKWRAPLKLFSNLFTSRCAWFPLCCISPFLELGIVLWYYAGIQVLWDCKITVLDRRLINWMSVDICDIWGSMSSISSPSSNK